jgi:lysozyme
MSYRSEKTFERVLFWTGIMFTIIAMFTINELAAESNYKVIPKKNAPLLWTDILVQHIMKYEGFSPRPYKDSDGSLKIGYGSPYRMVQGKPSVSQREAQGLVGAHLLTLVKPVSRILPNFKDLEASAKIVVMDMAYNLGPGRLKQFEDMVAFLRNEDYFNAANEVLDSRYACQVKRRAAANASLLIVAGMNSGEHEDTYKDILHL